MDKFIFFTTLVLFPFGQLLKFGFVNLFDVSVLILAIVTIFKKPKYPNWYKYFFYFLGFCLLTLLINYKLFDIKSLLYLIRLWSYSMVPVYLLNFYKDIKYLPQKLVGISVASAIFGWVQYLIWPDLTVLKYLGWDDHLLRMIGTFIDPTFLGLVIILGIIIASEKSEDKRTLLLDNKIIYFLIISLAFTYSRISFLILTLFLIYKKKYLGLLIFVITIFLLPKMIGEGTNLVRTASGTNKLINYEETISLIKKSPVFGLGFNNVCKARQVYLNDIYIDSHACSGADSSILFLLATTGIIGLALFVNFLLKVEINNLLLTSFIVVFIHSFFSNSFFYPHIMFWLFSLTALKKKNLQ